MLRLPKFLDAETLPTFDSSSRFNHAFEYNPEQKIRFIDSYTGRIWGFLVIDNTQRGPSIGGIRIAPDINLMEVSRLAYAMTLKNSVSCLPYGGGKAGLIADPILLAKEPNLKSDLISLFAEALFPFNNYISAPDMGTNEYDIQQIYEFNSKMLGMSSHARGGTGRGIKYGGIPIDYWELTAHGLVAALIKFENIYSDIKIKNSRVIIQGYGNVGAPTATKLNKLGAVIVGASDVNAGLWNSKGLDIEKLNSIRNSTGGLNNYNHKVERYFNSNQLDWLLEAPCDILVPAARPDAINSRNADRVQCKVILQGANSPINKMTEYYLNSRRKIFSLSDFIVNSGGVIGCAVEHKMKSVKNYEEKILAEGIRFYVEKLISNTISKNVAEVESQLIKKNNGDMIFREEAILLAKKRLLEIKNVWL